jgi:hypothetical protein
MSSVPVLGMDEISEKSPEVRGDSHAGYDEDELC